MTIGLTEVHLQLEVLEARRFFDAHFVIDPALNVHPISRFIYGVNAPLEGALSNATLTRLGGNRWTAYNWENNASNAGSDYLFQNDNFLVSGPAYAGLGATPGGAVIPMLNQASARNAGTLLTIPLVDYVSADKNGGGDVRNSGANYLQTRFRQNLPRKGTAFTLSPNLSDASVYQDEFVNWVKTNYPYGETDPNRPIWFSMDNEPDLWADTHAEVHSAKARYDEMITRTVATASAIKDVAPNTKIFGAANYGWYGYVTLQDAPDAAGRDFLNYYLQQMSAAGTTAGKRLLDVLDVHWYPEAQGGGVRITDNNTSAAVVAARLQAPRSLWDSTYTETSWITQYSTLGPINLIPRLQGKINTNYPGTKLSISEYNYGAGGHISGGIAQADALGIFGREGVFSANQWPLTSGETFVGGAFQMFRNYDGAGSSFGDTSVSATSDDVANSSIFASYDSANPSIMTLVAINKSASALTANLNLKKLKPAVTAQVYQLTSASASPQNAGTISIVDPGNFNYSMPAYSVSTIRVPLVAPAVNSASYTLTNNPNLLSFTFNQDVSASLASSDLTLSNLTAGGTVAATLASYNSSSNSATFNLSAPLADGNYQATINGAGIQSASGVPMTGNFSFAFDFLNADANRDRLVDTIDFNLLAANFGKSTTFTGGDFNYSGTVDSNDFNLLVSRFGKRVAAPSESLFAASSTLSVIDLDELK